MLDDSSGVSFFFGALIYKIQALVPHALTSLILNSIALSLYGIGYILWLIECCIDPTKRHRPYKWYGFSPVNTQFLVASVIGLVATGLAISAIFFSVFLVIPAAWLFTISNLFWAVGEYQKSKTAPSLEEDPTYPHNKQAAYLNYTLLACILSFISALITTLAVFFPLTIWIGLLITPFLGGMVIKSWADATFGTHQELQPPALPSSSSYQKINQRLPDSNIQNCLDNQNIVPSHLNLTSREINHDSYPCPSISPSDSNSIPAL